ncbi:MAG: hydroxyphenylacetyl-CoA thioesterase PaaI [Gammaproteobacteria bacterium]|nr:MAG: hydroxyphenylacetyl-CoA thioesterase PaaI [Gammaproteobacteria bacterium]
MDTEALYKSDPALKILGIQLISIGSGRAEMTMTVTPEMNNAYGICHGGYIFTLADSAFAYACNSYDFDAVAQTCTIDYMRPGKTGSLLTAVAEQKSQGRLTGLYDITISDEDQKIIAFFRGKSFRV